MGFLITILAYVGSPILILIWIARRNHKNLLVTHYCIYTPWGKKYIPKELAHRQDIINA